MYKDNSRDLRDTIIWRSALRLVDDDKAVVDERHDDLGIVAGENDRSFLSAGEYGRGRQVVARCRTGRGVGTP